MWRVKADVLTDDTFPYPNLVSTRASGNLKDDVLRREFCERHGIEFGSLVTAEQVHGTRVVRVFESDGGRRIPGCDGLITDRPGVSLGVFTADCMPVLLGARRPAAVGIVHAGWRGLYGGIIAEAIRLLRSLFGVDPADVQASIGPHIGQCCYVVSSDLKEKFCISESRRTLDLSAEAKRVLMAAGVNGAHISVNDHCTMHEEKSFFLTEETRRSTA